MTRSLFRIDRSAVHNSADAVVRLPNLEDLLPCDEPETPAPKEAAESNEQTEQDAELIRRQQELESLKQEMERVRGEARQLLTDTEAQCDQIREQARKEGCRAAAEDAKKERAAQREAFEKLCDTLQKAALEHQKKVEEGIFKVAMTVAEKIIGMELDRNDQAFWQIVKKTGALLQQDTKRDIHVSPEDYRRLISGEMEELNASGVRVVEDAALKRGDCFMVSEFGTVNTGVSSQLEHLKQAMGDG